MTTSRRIVKGGEDFYPTPKWAIEALFKNEMFSGEVVDPACGNGIICETAKQFNYKTSGQDLINRGYGETGIDFLTSVREYDNIVTNPPYSLADDFVLRALTLMTKKAAFLLRLSYLEGARRHKKIYSSIWPARVWVFSERITFYPDGVQTAGSGTLAYGWFVWDTNQEDRSTEINWITPGHKHD